VLFLEMTVGTEQVEVREAVGMDDDVDDWS
jgi:hypothetical protein